MAALKDSPDAIVKVQQILADKETRLKELSGQVAVAQAQSDAAVIESVNKTIQADAMGQSWLQRNAHSIVKLWVVGLLSAIYVVLPLVHRDVPSVPESVWLMLGAVLGIKSWHDGVTRTEAVKAGAS
jgi:hypothetical protein